ncbi:anthranilate synthase component I family protein [Porphyrobacter sp. GA68]|uniref:anthranilate synthase component I family protein n=1 Tax=Porphyrobacter sp. GA68 TaxID=2883480 RepID=UPI001D19230F|nr:chorismate-binding protein [Porphyrobacter sp. GA68]
MIDIQGAEVAAASLTRGHPACVHLQMVSDTLTPVAAALRLMEPARGDFLLESVEGGETRGRYSLLGVDPDLVFTAKNGRARINRVWKKDREAFGALEEAPLQALESLRRECCFDVPAALPPVLASLVGYLGFEVTALIEDLPAPAHDPLCLPDMAFVRPSAVVIFDQLKDEAFALAPIWTSQPLPPEQASKCIDEACERLRALHARLESGPMSPGTQRGSGPDPAEVHSPAAALAPTRYRELVRQAQEYIAAGDVFQVVLAQRFTAHFDLPALDLYRALRRINPSPFLYLLDLPGFALVGSSPEILVRVRDGDVTVRPIAGTRPRGRDTAADRQMETDLLNDPKERAEHLMLLDLGRNDVGRVARSGTVKVTASYTVERYSHVMHLVSNVTGRLAEGVGPLNAVLAGFPAGTVSGAPKVRACQIIAELENEVRGPYAGAVGYFAPDGSVDSCIVLRTAVLKDGLMHVTAGAGIVKDSDPEAEQRECEAKAGALFAAADEARRLAAAERLT